MNNLGAIESDRGNYSASEAYYRQAVAIDEKWYGPNHPETAANLTALSQTLTYEERFNDAEALLERALAIEKAVGGPVRSTLATTLNQLGIVAYNQKNYDAAKSYYNQAIDAWRTMYGDKHPYIATAVSNLGSICLMQKDYPCAERYFRESVRRLDSASPHSLNNAVAHIKLGRTLLNEQKFSDAEANTLSGYNYLIANVAQSNSFLGNARKDLAAIYDGLHQPEKAARFRAELVQAAANAPAK